MRRRPLQFLNVILVLVTFLAAHQRAGGEATTPQSRGLTLTFESLSPHAAPTFPDVRDARLVALYVPAKTDPSPFTPAGAFRATFAGDVSVRLRTYVQFSAQGRGKLTLSLNGKIVLQLPGPDLSAAVSKSVRLAKGKNHLTAVYESPAAGDASVRLLWSSRTWAAEPVPPDVFTHDAPDAGAAKSLLARKGRLLLAQFRCVRCHADGSATAPDAMPELAMDAPSLSDAGAQLNSGWIERWIVNPRALRPDAQMPRLFGAGPADAQKIADVAAYLSSLGQPLPDALAGDASSGGKTFANLDCVACHTPPDAKPDGVRVRLDMVRSKFKPAALRDFLLNPQAHFAWNPMPNFRLSDREASDLTAYLQIGPAASPASAPPGDPSRGRELVASIGCLNCHQIADQKSALHAPPLGDLTGAHLEKDCLADHPVGAPDFGFSAEQRAALAAFLQTDRASLRRRCAPEFADRQIASMRCTACHARDGQASQLAQAFDADSQSLHRRYPNPAPSDKDLLAADQRPPLLTWAGEKLRPQWMARFIGGQINYKPRYYLRARMPGFAARAQFLTTGLADEQGFSPAADPPPAPDMALAKIGRQLCGKTPNVGLSCVQCHAAGDQPPFAAFEAPSINLKYIAARLRHEYFTRWMRDPQRVDPNAKMPKFEDSDGKTGLATFDHDGAKQFEAVWQYLLEGKQLQPPQ